MTVRFENDHFGAIMGYRDYMIGDNVISRMDVNTAFLNDELEEEVYMIQPQGFIMPDNENKVCKLVKSLYGLKQAPKQWHQKFNEVVLSNTKLTNVYIENLMKLRALKYLKKTTNYSLTYTGYLSVLEGYSDASWINNFKDNSSTSGWVFLLGRGAMSWASKKQTCITDTIMESEFVALAAAEKEAKWLRNLILDIPLWSKPIAPKSIRCDSAATLAKALAKYTVGSLDT
nr:zinc finger, CCHC-type [Tanacetum cinerariifolium]